MNDRRQKEKSKMLAKQLKFFKAEKTSFISTYARKPRVRVKTGFSGPQGPCMSALAIAALLWV